MDYEERLSQLRAELNRQEQAVSTTFQLLVALAAATIAIIWFAAQTQAFPFGLAFVTVIPGRYLFRRMDKLSRRANELRRVTVFYKRMQARRQNQWMDHPETGEEFEDSSHLFAGDLDLFGRGSLFQFMSIARTGVGRDALARYMTDLATEPEAKARAAAVAELRGQSAMREAVAAAGHGSTSDCRTETFTTWLLAPSRQIPAWARPLAFFLSLGIPVIGALALARIVPASSLIQAVLLWAGVEGLFAVYFRDRVKAVIADLGMPSIDLAILADLIKIVESQKFEAAKLQALSDTLVRRDSPASTEIARLRRMSRFLEVGTRYFEPLTWILLWETQFALAIERWRESHAEEMQLWLNAVGEFEALNAISAYAFDCPQDAIVEFVEGPAHFEAIGLGHPLLDPEKCVRNDVVLGDGQPLLIVSGSNMSGKSTLLRACGLSIVLASMGAPVRATRFRVSDLSLAASIRLQDSLLDGKSKFFVEVERLKNIIDLAKGTRPLLFLVDELLSGTNSQDRLIASQAVILTLLENGAVGLMTTHDLALTLMADEPGVHGRNVHLADSSDSGGLDFDYTLRPGVIQQTNALAIVELLGIPLTNAHGDLRAAAARERTKPPAPSQTAAAAETPTDYPR